MSPLAVASDALLKLAFIRKFGTIGAPRAPMLAWEITFLLVAVVTARGVEG